ncbi:MAG: HD domain-containing protein [Bacilli bacterium]|nr:HD domain-containing protein [Bacilli bacterium]
MNNVNKKLKDYIEQTIFPQYDTNIGGHGLDHINQVIERTFEIIKEFNLKVNLDIAYTIAAYHDLGYKKDPDNHEEVSAKMFLDDIIMQDFFNEEDRKIIYEAIIDHRASLEYEARNIYGKIVSSADREISVENMLKRSYLFQKDKHKAENPTQDEIIAYSYKKLSSKYGKEGYAKMYYPDKKYLEFINEMQDLIENKEKFISRERKLKL